MLEKVLDLKNTFEGKFLAVLMSVILVLSMTNIMAFAGDTSQADASASDASVPAETAPDSSNALVNEPSANAPVKEPVVEAPALSPEVGEALVTFETENAYVTVNDQVLSGTTLTTELHKELAFVAAPDSGFEIDSIKAYNAANAEVPVTTQDGISKIAADYVDSTLVVTVAGKAIETQVEAPVTDPITSDTKIEAEETPEAVTGNGTVSARALMAAPQQQISAVIRHVDGDAEDRDVSIATGDVVAPAVDGCDFINATVGVAGDVVTYTAMVDGKLYYGTQESLANGIAREFPEGEKLYLNYETTPVKHAVEIVVEGDTNALVDGNEVVPGAGTVEVVNGETLNFQVRTMVGYTAKVTYPGGTSTIKLQQNQEYVERVFTTKAITAAGQVKVEFTRQHDLSFKFKNPDAQFWHGEYINYYPLDNLVMQGDNLRTSTSSFTYGSTISFGVTTTLGWAGIDKYGYWQLNGLAINGQGLNIPENKDAGDVGNSATTVLGNGSTVTIKVTNADVGTYNNKNKTPYALFSYSITIENARENIIITSGNFHNVFWPEILVRKADGVKNVKFDGGGEITIGQPVTQKKDRVIVFDVLPGYENPVVLLDDEPIVPNQVTNGHYSFKVPYIDPGSAQNAANNMIFGERKVEIMAELAKYTVAYTDNGVALDQCVTSGSYDVITNTQFVVSPVNPVKAGYRFTGWKLGDATYLPGQVVNVADVMALASEGNVLTFEAQWESTDQKSYYVSVTCYDEDENILRGPFNYEFSDQSPVMIIGSYIPGIDGYEYDADNAKNKSTATPSEAGAGDESEISIYYKLGSYQVVYDYGVAPEGASALPSQETHTYKSAVNVAEPATAPGYSFSGWTTSDVKVSEEGSFAMPAQTVTFKGTWTPDASKLSYEGNGATGGATSATTGRTGDRVSVAANGFERPGYTFTGWNTAANGSGDAYAPGSLFQLPAGGAVLYAQWEVNTAEVSVWFRAAGDTAFFVDTNNQIATAGSAANKFSKTITTENKTGYSEEDLKSWAGEAYALTTDVEERYADFELGVVRNGSWTKIDSLASFTIEQGDELRYYVLPEFAHTLTYQAGAGTGKALTDDSSYYSKDTVAVKSFEDTGFTAPAGYAFDHWQVVSETGSINGDTFTMGEGDAVLEAVYKAVEVNYTVEHYKVSADGKSANLVANDTQTLQELTGTPVSAAANTYPGYTYQPAFDQYGMKTVVSGEVAGDGSLVLKLYYTPNNDELVYDGNGATGGATDATAGKVDQQVSVAANGFEREGYTFVGWNTAADGTGIAYAVNDAYALTPGDDVLYAQWKADFSNLEAKGFSVTYDGQPHAVTVEGALPTDRITYMVERPGESTTAENSFVNVVDTAKVTVTVVRGGESITLESVTAEIKPVEVEITVDSKSKTFNEADPEFTGSVKGVLANDLGLGDVTFGRAVDDQGKEAVGDDITLVPTYTENPNYQVTVVNGKLTIVESGALSLNATGYEGVYDGQNHGIAVNTNLQSDQVTIEYSTDGKTWTTAAPSAKDVADSATYQVRATAAGYKTAIVENVALKINPAQVAVTANDANKLFGETDPQQLNYTTGAAVAGETPGFAGALERETGEAVGEYAINQGTLTLTDNGAFKAANYKLVFAPGTFTIAQKLGTVNVEKVWQNPGGAITENPEVELQLYQDGQPYGEPAMLKNGVTTHAFANLPQGKTKAEAGNGATAHEYTVVETSIGGASVMNGAASAVVPGIDGAVKYTSKVEAVAGGFKITNARTSVIVELQTNTTDRTVARSESLAHAFSYSINGSTHQLSGVASVKKAVDPGTLNVSVEAKPTAWNTTYAVDGGAAKQGTFANVPALTDLKVSFTNDRVPLRYNVHKLWVTDDPTTLPDSLAIEVFQSADQHEPYTPNGNRYETTMSEWEPAGQGVYEKTVAYDELFPRAALDGALYHYSAVEELPENYLEPGNGHTNWSAGEGSVDADGILSFTGDLYNYYNVTSVSGTKTWEDFGREVTHDNATEVQLVLERSSDGGATWTKVNATPTWNGDRYTFSGLEKYTELPFANEYRVTEQPVEGYVTTQDGTNFTNRAVRTLAIEAGSNSWTYDGAAHSEDSYQLTIDGAEPIAVGEDGTYTFPNGDVLKATVEGSVTNVADTQAGNNQVTGWTLVDANGADISAAYQVSTTPGTLSITPAELAITVTGNRAQVTFDGQAHVVEGFTYDNTDKATVTLKDGVQARAEGTDVKTYPMGLTPESFKWDAPNYNVTLTVNDGQLEILPANVMTVDAPDVEAVYDGNGHATIAVPSVQDGVAQVRYYNEATDAYDLEVAPQFTDAGTYTVRFQATHPNYNPAEGSATVVVKKRPVTLTSVSDEKVYDGAPLTADAVQVGGEGFAAGEGATFSNFATITDAGTAENVFAYTLNANTSASNYIITSAFGTLEVKPAPLTVRIEGSKKTVEFTGDLQSVEGYRVLDDVAGKATIALKPGSAAFASGTVVGDYPMNLTAGDFDVKSKNYTVTLEVTDGNLTITPAGTLAVLANPVSEIYDGANHGVEAVASVPGATVKYWSDETNDYTLDASPTFRDVTGEPKTVKFKASLANYDDAYGETTVEVTPRSVTLTSASASKMYDGQPLTNTQMSVGGMGFVAGEEPTVSVTGSQTDAGTTKNTFTYAFPQNVQAGNYTVTTVEGDLTVEKAPLAVTVTGNHDTRTYDGALQSIEGFTTDAGDKATVALKDGVLARAEGTDAGTYPMGLAPTSFDVASQNYEVTLTVTDGWLTILPAGVMQVSADSVEKTYDGARVGIEAKASVEGATVRYYNEATGAFDLAQSPTFLDAGTYEVRFQATHPNYETTEGAATVVVKPRAVMLTSASAEKVYDGQPLMAASVQEGGEGFVSGEGATYDGFAGIINAGVADNAFSYELSANTKPENYVITTQVGVLTVHKAPLAVTVTGAQAFTTYDGAAHAANGFTDDAGDKATVTLKDGVLARAEGANAGTYAMGLTAASFNVVSQNYEVALTVVDGQLEVGPAPLLVVANDASKSYGQDDPTLSAAVNGLVTGDEFNGAYTLVRDAGEAPGSYGIEVRDAVSFDPNYTVQTAPGTFTITAAEGATIVVTGGTKVYDGAPLEPTGFTATGLAAGDVLEVVLSGEQTDAGTSEAGVESFVIRNAAGEDVTASYADVTVVPGTLTVVPAEVVIAVADAAKTAGAADPAFTGTVTGLVQPDDLGEIAYVRTNADEVAGVYADVLTATFTENPNYAVTVVPGTFTITTAPVVPVTPVTPPVTPTPTTPTTPTPAVTPGTVPPDAPPIVAPVVEALQNAVETIIPPAETPLAEPQQQTIADDENPLAGYDRVNCWVHYYLILGIIVTLLYGAGVLARRLRFAHKLKALENDVLGIEDEAAAAAPTVPLAPTGKEA